MNQKDRVVIVSVLMIIAIMASIDIFTDYREGADIWHVFFEGLVALIALFGIFYVLRGSFKLKRRFEDPTADVTDYKKEAKIWKLESKKYLKSLSYAIDQQLIKWKLSDAEKKVAFLLLKGMNLKEIAVIRKTSEKTISDQSLSIYSKSGLSGHAELSSYFFEDLLVPETGEGLNH